MTLFKRRPQLAHFELSSPPPTEAIHKDPVLDVSESERVAKRRRIESYAMDYLKGREIFIASASLKGPFDKSWVNPWRSKLVDQQKSCELHAGSEYVPKNEEARVNAEENSHQHHGENRPTSKANSDYCHDWIRRQEIQEYSLPIDDGIEGEVRDVGPDIPIITRPGNTGHLEKRKGQYLSAGSLYPPKASGLKLHLDSESISPPINSVEVDAASTERAVTETSYEITHPIVNQIEYELEEHQLAKVSAITEGVSMPLEGRKTAEQLKSTSIKLHESPGFPFKRARNGTRPKRRGTDTSKPSSTEADQEDALTIPAEEAEGLVSMQQDMCADLEDTGIVVVAADFQGKWACPVKGCPKQDQPYRLRSTLANHLKNLHNIHKTRTMKNLKPREISKDLQEDEAGEAQSAGIENVENFNAMESSSAVVAVEVAANAQGKWPCPINGCSKREQSYTSRGSLSMHLKQSHQIHKTTARRPTTGRKLRDRKPEQLSEERPNQNGNIILLAADEQGKWPCPIEGCQRVTPYANRGGIAKHLKGKHGVTKTRDAASRSNNIKIDIKMNAEGKYVCPIGGCRQQSQMYAGRSGLEFHLKTVHKIDAVRDISRSDQRQEQKGQNMKAETILGKHKDPICERLTNTYVEPACAVDGGATTARVEAGHEQQPQGMRASSPHNPHYQEFPGSAYQALQPAIQTITAGTESNFPNHQPDFRSYSNYTVNPEVSTQAALQQAHDAFQETPWPEKVAHSHTGDVIGPSNENSETPQKQNYPNSVTPLKQSRAQRLPQSGPDSVLRAVPVHTQDLLNAAADLSFSTVKKQTAKKQTSFADWPASKPSQLSVSMKRVECSPAGDKPVSGPSLQENREYQLSEIENTPVLSSASKGRRENRHSPTMNVENTPLAMGQSSSKIQDSSMPIRPLSPTEEFLQFPKSSDTPSAPSEMPIPSYQQAQKFNTQDVENALDDAMSFLGTWNVEKKVLMPDGSQAEDFSKKN